MNFVKTVLLNLVCVLLLITSCKPQEGCTDPVSVLRMFISSISYGDSHTAYNLLCAGARSVLESRAKRIAEASGLKLQPFELIVPERVGGSGEIVSVKVKEKRDDRVFIDVKFSDGSLKTVEMRKEGGCFKINIKL